MLKNQGLKKIYWVICLGHPVEPQQRLEHHLVHNPKINKSTVYNDFHPKGKKAIMEYKMLQKFDHYSLLEVQLHTGRHHQIRVQLAKIGHPIKGDQKYGAPRGETNGYLYLHARQLSFVHPVQKEPLCFTAPILITDVLWQSISE
jgi:23S rRNA pseudouridine1911/1915/1917 synthase